MNYLRINFHKKSRATKKTGDLTLIFIKPFSKIHADMQHHIRQALFRRKTLDVA
jgi:hypothetical protein